MSDLPGGHNDLGLLLDREVGPSELWIDVVLVHLEDLVVGHGARVCEVHDTGQLPPRHLDRVWEELWEDGHRVRDVDDLYIVVQGGFTGLVVAFMAAILKQLGGIK